MILIRRARPDDARAIAAVHVEAWRSAYAGILPENFLAGLSVARLAAEYARGMLVRRDGHAVFVAVAEGAERPGDAPGARPVVVGFASGGRARRALGEVALGEVETLYLLDDFRERGIGRRLMRAMAAHLAAIGCGGAMLWVLSDNPSLWFYRHLGGKPVARETITVGGQPVEQTAVLWEPIGSLLLATAPTPGG
jgi:hypothetical protein